MNHKKEFDELAKMLPGIYIGEGFGTCGSYPQSNSASPKDYKRLRSLLKKVGCKEIVRDQGGYLVRASNTGFFFTGGSSHGYLLNSLIKPESKETYISEHSWRKDTYVQISKQWYLYQHTREE